MKPSYDCAFNEAYFNRGYIARSEVKAHRSQNKLLEVLIVSKIDVNLMLENKMNYNIRGAAYTIL